MLRNRRGAASLLFVVTLILLLSSTLTYNMYYANKQKNMNKTVLPSGDIVHSPVFIDSDDDFGTLGFPGVGSSGNPYRIENYLIDGTATEHGIYISGTTVHFTIKNCTLRGIMASGMAGIYLDNVEKGLVINNTAYNFEAGLALYYADNNTITDNSFYENDDGIGITWGENNTINNNNCSHNSEAGIQLSRAYRNRLINNDLTFNYWDIIGWRSDYNNVTGNRMGWGSGKQAIFWDDSQYNRIEHNLVEECTNGIRIYSSDAFTVANNTLMNCHSGIWFSSWGYGSWIFDNLCVDNINGILLSTVYSNYVFDNNCTNNQVGIAVIDSSGTNDIYENECRNCTYGISIVWQSQNNEITDNLCIENGIGIRVADTSARNHIESNLCLNNSIGINVAGTTHNNTVVNNFCGSKTALHDYGIVINEEAEDNYISYNNCTLANYGICFSDTTFENLVTDNFIYKCQTGVYLNETERARFEVNIIKDCSYGIEITDKTNISHVRWNTFLNNDISAEDNGTANIFDFNFWSDYVGVDGDSDGIGDTPYAILGTATNEDPHPVVNHPARPTWDHPIETQAGEAGYPFRYDLNASAAAPIGSWGIDDIINFAIDSNGVVTNAAALSIGDYDVMVWVETIYGVNLTATFTVKVNDTIAPTVDHPADITFSEYPDDSSVADITWTPSDMTDLDWKIFIDGDEEIFGTWKTDEDPITENFQFLGVGTHNITILLTDQGDNSVSDTVIVTVTEQVTTPPTSPTTPTTSPLPSPVDFTLLLVYGPFVVIVVIVIVVWRKRR